MPTISYDAQSLMVDGRRIWLVSGSVQYARVPAELWRRRIRAAREAGLNCIDTFVVWADHEIRPGKFDFEGDRDLRRFVQTVGAEGMYCVLRPGPYIGADWDNGGLPPWLTGQPEMIVRQGHQPFLERAAKYLGAVMEQVKDLQVSTPIPSPPRRALKEEEKPTKKKKKGKKSEADAEPAAKKEPAAPTGPPGGGKGPIILFQAENEWFCHHAEQGHAYLREVVRYLRENGCEVPVIENNRRWQTIDGAFSTWSGRDELLADMRQFRIVQQQRPAQHFPRIVSEYWTGVASTWGGERGGDAEPGAGAGAGAGAMKHDVNLAQILAAGAQYNVYPFHGGTSFGFAAGRSLAGPDAFVTTSHDCGAPLSETGERGEDYLAIKRVSTFASQFGFLFAHLDPDSHPAALPPSRDGGAAVVHLPGAQGDVGFVFRGAARKVSDCPVMLPSGLTIDVSLGEDDVAWYACDVNLGIADLTYTNLRPWAFVDRKLLVLFGPPGAEGVVCLDGAPLAVKVPTGKTPVVETVEDLHVAVLNSEQADAALVTPNGLLVGVSGLDDGGEPVAHASFKSPVRITSAGEVEKIDTQPSPPKRRAAPKLEDWHSASVESLITGEDEAFKPIDEPASLETLGESYGYGWYRLSLKGVKSTSRLFAPQWAHRLHVFSDGKRSCLLGVGPNAKDEPVTVSAFGLSDSNDVVVLADNLGRFSAGWRLGEPAGLHGHLYELKTARLNKAKCESGPSIDLSPFRGYLADFEFGHVTTADTLCWQVKPVGRQAMIVDIRDLPVRCALIANEDIIGVYDPLLSAGGVRFTLEVGTHIKGGKNELKLALFEPHDGKTDPRDFVTVYQTTNAVTAKNDCAFAPWTMPGDDAFSADASLPSGLPGWHRCAFELSHTDLPLWLEPRGLTKGQLFLNGRNLGRYFVATPTGKAMPGQKRYYLPEPWLYTDRPNVLMMFEEHGKSGEKCKLVYG